jgi:30S ribosomal protein S31
LAIFITFATGSNKSTYHIIFMGKGDKKSRRGKIIIGSFGVRRPRRKAKAVIVEKPLGPKPKKPVEEQILIPLEMPEVPVIETGQETPVVKKAAKKPAAKKPAEKAEKEVKVEKEVLKVVKETPKEDKEPAKPKTPKAKKKPAEAPKDSEEPVKE